MGWKKRPRCNGRGKLSWDDGNPVYETMGTRSILGLILDAFTGGAEICPLCKGKGYVPDKIIKIYGKYDIYLHED